MECFAKMQESDYFHPLNLVIAQEKDKTILKKLNTQYMLKEYQGGGKTKLTDLLQGYDCSPKLITKHVIMWYHNTLCHPGINHWSTFMVAQDERSDVHFFVHAVTASRVALIVSPRSIHQPPDFKLFLVKFHPIFGHYKPWSIFNPK